MCLCTLRSSDLYRDRHSRFVYILISNPWKALGRTKFSRELFTAEIDLEGEVLQVPAYGSAKGDRAGSGEGGVEIQGRIKWSSACLRNSLKEYTNGFNGRGVTFVISKDEAFFFPPAFVGNSSNTCDRLSFSLSLSLFLWEFVLRESFDKSLENINIKI